LIILAPSLGGHVYLVKSMTASTPAREIDHRRPAA